MYCPTCLPNGPKPAGTDPESGQPLDVSQRYFCKDHQQTANLRPKGNGQYECHCGWKSESRKAVDREDFEKLEARVESLAAKLKGVK